MILYLMIVKTIQSSQQLSVLLLLLSPWPINVFPIAGINPMYLYIYLQNSHNNSYLYHVCRVWVCFD